MSKLDEIFNGYDRRVHNQSVRLSKGFIPVPMVALHDEAKQQIKDLMLELIGEDEVTTTKLGKDIVKFNGQKALKNRWKAELRQKVEAL